jgi:small subunit ribosomal protein S9
VNEIYGTGRRKTSSARVFLRPGSGVVTVNGKSIDEYFADDLLKMIVRQPLVLLEKSDAFDVTATVTGGGHSGQAGAIRHGVTRALMVHDQTVRPQLKAAGLVTRDPRKRERKKYGQKGARARFQFSKR